jgi:hypothetical protein
MATSPVAVEGNDSKVRFARWMFLSGVIAVWMAIVVSVVF